ncbi:MAG: DnaD domain protein [Bacilli bacterium]|nr:DnaD domain protein [Bacilli bacterium]
MKYGKLVDIVKSGNINIPLYVYKEYPHFGIDLETFIFLMYLYSKGNKIFFDINIFSQEFFCDLKTIMKYISILQEKKLIEIKVIKNDKNIMEEYIYLDLFYEKISLNLIGEITKKEEDDSDVFQTLEHELGKQLSPIEVEIVKAWKESSYSDDIIKEAIKEAVMNGVANLRYIDKILYEWAKKGIKTKEDVLKNRKEFRGEKEREKNKKVDLFDYDWMEDDEQ